MTAFVVAALVAVLGLLALLRWRRLLPVDLPNERSLHTRPTPRIGGLALLPAVLAGAWLGGVRDFDSGVLLICAAALFVVSVGDDRYGLGVGLRLLAHIGAALGFCLWLLGPLPVAVLAALGLVWLVNLYNFMDGANGLAGGMALIGFGALALASGNAPLGWAIAGAAAGFLCFNIDPARVFLGDAGSVPLGLLAGGLGLLGAVRGDWPLWFPLLVFSPFIVDATATLLRRLLRGEKVWQAHREHYYQRLVRMGWSHRRLALTEYVLMATVATSALALLAAPLLGQWLGVAAWGLVYAGLMYWIDRLWQRNQAG
jgi:UDP-N-acetylmuramyl pentapeptide phosphotransferase/UDP-N-acetylglucosamine-1-phosphate transferase